MRRVIVKAVGMFFDDPATSYYTALVLLELVAVAALLGWTSHHAHH